MDSPRKAPCRVSFVQDTFRFEGKNEVLAQYISYIIGSKENTLPAIRPVCNVNKPCNPDLKRNMVSGSFGVTFLTKIMEFHFLLY